ncbi:hypothetical protein SAMN07250955_10210 [Arboricoccus pini]|uniref:N-acetyltransferase domain-containing protein n=1 Tax=Arboricoccus pini TaxID=1963835 RepID=A0A212QMP8_9PROT|nr:N-acetyltransferase [Arboricoccus pini]SNB60637.1 hypothetical protein SAMN07250955_10210 [Arboricoccus pini]
MSTLTLEPITDKAGIRRFVTAPDLVYEDDPTYVHPLVFERMEHLDAKKNPFLKGIEIAYWLAHRDGRPVGRISAQINARHLERYQDSTGQFGFFECMDDPEAAAALLKVAEDWLRAKGMRRVKGPFNPTINDEVGLLVKGLETPPMMMMGHGRAWYPKLVEGQGYQKVQDLLAYHFNVQAPWPAAAQRIIDRSAKLETLHIRPLDMKRFDEEIRLVCDIFNDAWANNWGFIPFGEDEAAYLAKSIKMLVDARHFAIGEIDGVPAAMVVTIPNVNEAAFDLKGHLLPFGWAKLLWRLKVKGVKSSRMPLMGVRQAYQHTAKGAALALGVIGAVKDYHKGRGVEWAELSWILESNRAMNDLIVLVGGVPYKTYRIYEKALA